MHSWLDNLAERRIAIIRDAMLDRYVGGAVDRISPEAPVPVVCIATERVTTGGTVNIARLGETVPLVGVVGDDEDWDLLVRGAARGIRRRALSTA